MKNSELVKALREELGKRNSQLMKLKEEKAMLGSGEASSGQGRVRFSSDTKEKEELRMTIR